MSPRPPPHQPRGGPNPVPPPVMKAPTTTAPEKEDCCLNRAQGATPSPLGRRVLRHWTAHPTPHSGSLPAVRELQDRPSDRCVPPPCSIKNPVTFPFQAC